MALPKIVGIETEYGIVHRGTDEPNPITASSLLINAFVSDLVDVGSPGDPLPRVGWDFEDESPGADARGMVLVFDEADAGIGGRAADRVGRALAGLAAHHQVLCITHLPQIAAFANVHFRVDKREARGRTCARLQRVEGDARIEELARMAGGERVGAATLRHARELLAERCPSASNS